MLSLLPSHHHHHKRVRSIYISIGRILRSTIVNKLIFMNVTEIVKEHLAATCDEKFFQVASIVFCQISEGSTRFVFKERILDLPRTYIFFKTLNDFTATSKFKQNFSLLLQPSRKRNSGGLHWNRKMRINPCCQMQGSTRTCTKNGRFIPALTRKWTSL